MIIMLGYFCFRHGKNETLSFFVGNKANGRISKRMLQDKKAR